MAARYPSDIKMVAKYKCPDCGMKWKSKNSQGGPKQCDVCQKGFFKPYKYEPMKKEKKKTQKRQVRRQFGDFECVCSREWKSANCWEKVWQKCNRCHRQVYPINLRPLSYQGGEGGKPHEMENCGMCQELGYNCKNYSSLVTEAGDGDSDDDDDDDDDDFSVYSEASSISSLSEDDRQLKDEDVTPVQSDDDETEERLDKALGKMRLKD